MSKKDADQLVQDLKAHFKAEGVDYTIEKRSGHWHILNANGKSIYNFGGTPSEHRFRQNTVAALRRLEIVPRDWR